MSNLKLPYLKNNGFSVIECIMVICISSVLLLTSFSMYQISEMAAVFVESEDEILLYGRYLIDYIKHEVRESDLVISSNKITDLNTTYPSNLGFVIMNDKGESHKPADERYGFATYYLKGDKLIRIACNKRTSSYPNANSLKGYNELSEGILSMDGTNLDFDNKLLKISIKLGNGDKEVHRFRTTLFLATNLDY